ncbi:MAG TPA: glycosyl transferase family 1 [Colwellia sp.]|nr:glycosyl transferase family 1 [Colwellia sp.]|tara:strand:- start:881 stop:2041 length:1161 start_codon:yes stop_codon:yes gene_type:complete
MKILFVHNFYQVAGGEDAVYKNENTLLEINGHQVIEYTVNNISIKSLWDKIGVIFSTIFSISQYRNIKRVLTDAKPDVVHVHNYFPLISPAFFYACKKANVPVVHTLHNYRAVCPTALLMHEGKINETSVKSNSWWTVRKKVYRNSYIGSFALACMVELHKKLGTWQTKVDCFIALTEFSRQKYIEAGWPARKIVVKANFIEDVFEPKIKSNKGTANALFIGRLSEEKGISTLLTAWKNISFRINIIGEGAIDKPVGTSINLLGRKTKKEVISFIKKSSFIVVPSICYEGFPMAIVEAFACGTPVICSRIGSMKEIVVDGVTGLHFEAGNSVDLAEKVQWMFDNPDKVKKMGSNARKEYLAKYTPEKNHQILMGIYHQAIEEANSK